MTSSSENPLAKAPLKLKIENQFSEVHMTS